MSAFPGGSPTAVELDAVVPDRPVFLYNRDHHGAVKCVSIIRLIAIRLLSP
jgi:hypothetical protein